MKPRPLALLKTEPPADPFKVFQSPGCDREIERLVKSRFVAVERYDANFRSSVTTFMQRRYPRSTPAEWAPKGLNPLRAVLVGALVDKSHCLAAPFWKGYCLQMADLVTTNHLAEGTLFEVPEHNAMEKMIPVLPDDQAYLIEVLEGIYRPTHPIRQILFGADSHYLVRKLQGKP